MECPYCQKEMVEGYIYGDRYFLKWLPADKKLFWDLHVVQKSYPTLRILLDLE